jgi:hypothetical protein
MAFPPCEECKAIYQELLLIVELSCQTKPGPGAGPADLAAWFDERDEDLDYKKRVRAALTNVKQRIIEHQKQTGHVVPSPLHDHGLINPN